MLTKGFLVEELFPQLTYKFVKNKDCVFFPFVFLELNVMPAI